MSLDGLKMRASPACFFLVSRLMLGAAVLAFPPHQPRAGERVGHDDILAAVRQGEIRSLSEIEAFVIGKLPGETIKVEIGREHDRWVYEFKVLDRLGRRFDVYVDARTGDILETKTK